MQIRWSPEAADDLAQIGRRIQKENPGAAREVVLELYWGIANLRVFPRRARTGRIEGTRELVFAPLPYIAVYRIKDEVIEIARIYHAAQDWP